MSPDKLPHAHVLTAAQISDVLQIGETTAIKLIRGGSFPGAFRVGRVWRVPASDVTAFMSSGGTVSREPEAVP